ncbi:MAG: ATP-binding protein [Gammaproteobacteria bacterium]|nr:ATP-binding protein [Gammaproteobacteria bacterium]
MEYSQIRNSSTAEFTPSVSKIDIRAEQTHHLYGNITTAIMANTGIALLLLWVLKDHVDQTLLNYWISALSIILVARGLGLYVFKKISPEDQNINIWLYAFAIKSTLAAFIWGISIWVFEPYNNPEIPILITFVLGGMTAGAAAILGSVFTVYILYVLACMLPITIWFFLQTSEMHSIMAMMLCIYMLAMISGGYTYQKVMLKSILLSRQLIKAKEQAEQANQAKSIFLSRMSHELRTPLNAIMGFAQLISHDKNQSEKQKDHSNEIIKASTILLKLIEDLLDLSRIEANKIDINIEEVDCHKLISECVDLINPVVEKYQIQLKYKTGNTVNQLILADEFRLKQILLNLLSNACKYNRPNGSVTISYTAINNIIRISIEDTGIGIAPEKQDKVFQSYERLGNEDTLIEGTGIGLTIVKQLANLMDAQVGFESRENEGSTFWIDLPAA